MGDDFLTAEMQSAADNRAAGQIVAHLVAPSATSPEPKYFTRQKVGDQKNCAARLSFKAGGEW